MMVCMMLCDYVKVFIKVYVFGSSVEIVVV